MIYQLQLGHQEEMESMDLNRNCLEDLLSYRYEGQGLTEWDFLESSMRNFENEKEVFTFSRQGKLELLVWFQQPINDVDSPTSLPENSIVLQELFYTPSSLKDIRSFLFEVANLLSREFKTREIYLVANGSQPNLFNSSTHNTYLVKKEWPALLELNKNFH